MIVCINKIDEKTINYDHGRIGEITTETGAFLKKIGYNTKNISFVPISGWTGDNMLEKCDKISSWYKGKTLFDTLNDITPPKRPTDKPLRLPL